MTHLCHGSAVEAAADFQTMTKDRGEKPDDETALNPGQYVQKLKERSTKVIAPHSCHRIMPVRLEKQAGEETADEAERIVVKISSKWLKTCLLLQILTLLHLITLTNPVYCVGVATGVYGNIQGILSTMIFWVSNFPSNCLFLQI